GGGARSGCSGSCRHGPPDVAVEALPSGSTNPARNGGGPSPESVSVDRLPSTGATVIPPAKARYDGTPTWAAPTSSTDPGSRSIATPNSAARPSTVTCAGAPVTATVVGVSARSATPVSVVSRPAVPSGFP